MAQAPYEMDREARGVVLAAVREVCSYRRWGLLAAHVRTNHVHVVVESEARPERIMNDLKAYASRSLHRLGPGAAERRYWAYHGSTRWLWRDQEARAAVRYVVEEQGEPMAVFVGDVP
jgi:REP element-mobilizing transposase RayT